VWGGFWPISATRDTDTQRNAKRKRQMKLTAIALTAFIMATPAMAEPLTAETCTSLGNLAEVIMEKRQEGFTLSQMMEISDVPAIQAMVMGAFQAPFMTYDENKNDSIRQFRELYELACFKLLGEQA
jgi:ABC-type amino acid transport substrate-binding protein